MGDFMDLKFLVGFLLYSSLESKMAYILIDKPPGWTPLELIDKLRQIKPELEKEKMTYAGRLDPMAEGLLVILFGNERYEAKKYMQMNKTYQVEYVLGLRSDTGDALGLVEKVSPEIWPDVEVVKNTVEGLVRIKEMRYPAYSSKTVAGRPLLEWARTGKLDEIEIPVRQVGVLHSRVNQIEGVGLEELIAQATDRVERVSGDFRQDAVIEAWRRLADSRDQKVIKVSSEVEVGSGTYVRGLAEILGEKLDCGAMAWKIKRTRLGRFSLDEAEKLE